MYKPVLFDINEAEPDTSRPGGISYFFQGCENVTIQYTEIFDKPETFPHSHDYEQFIYCISGKANFWCGEETYELSEGCMMVIPSNAPHGIEKVIGSERLKLFEFFYPKQEKARVQSKRVKDLGHHNWDKL